MSTVFAKIQMRRGTAASWAAANPVLAQGELAFETDTGRTKVGDGATAYLSLPSYATYDQMVAALEEIEDATAAVVAASNAAQAAETASETAQAAAETARTAAQTSASQAGASKDAAALSATAAATSASDADADRIAAQTARTASESARDASQAAQTASETARNAAQSAQTGAQTARTGAETAQTGAQAARTGAEAAQAAAAGSLASAIQQAQTAQAQASLAQGHAASAASVVQQDLSGVTAQALHRSPNAITAMHIYDTSKDSDGGAWTKKCQHTSWWNEAINGRWLGAQANETVARQAFGTLGAELFPSNDFSSTTGLSLVSGAAVANGVLTLAAVANSRAEITTSNTIAANEVYEIELVITATDGGTQNLDVQVNSAGGFTQSLLSLPVPTVGTHRTRVSLNASYSGSAAFRIIKTSATGTTTIDRVSIRRVSGGVALPGDYFQRTSDGRFYSLNAGSGITEVYRGNKRDFPRLAGIVAEAGNVNIYDLTEPGRPMWMRFFGGNSSCVVRGNNLTCITSFGGFLYIGHGTSFGLAKVDFVNDKATLMTTSGEFLPRNISNRNDTSFVFSTATNTTQGPSVVNAAINAVAMTVLPDAPIDPATGLRVPTIAVATSGGVSVIKHNGTVVNSLQAYSFTAIGITRDRVMYATYSSTHCLVWNDISILQASFGYTRLIIGTTNISSYLSKLAISSGGAVFTDGGKFIQLLKLAKPNANTIANATITPTYNTGWMTGDIRRCYLSDATAMSISGNELISDPSFDNSAAWTLLPQLSVTGGNLLLSAGGSGGSAAYIPVSVSPGELVEVTIEVTAISGTTAQFEFCNDANGTNPTGLVTLASTAGTFTTRVRKTGFQTGIRLRFAAGASNTATIASISVKELLSDRSYKSAVASITGTLTKAQLASGTSLVGYSGFSASNYLREPYSADLDFGTGEWTASAWVNVPTSNSAAGTILSRAFSSGAYFTLGVDATNKLTATAYDGTTTRTVTSTAAYNTATWLKARVSYTTDGSLALMVNGREVAVTRGTPLLTLNNSSAVLTIGNSYALDAPFPGSIALLKLGATVPTPEQSVFMYEQEKQLFRAGAQSVLPDSGAIVDMAYDDATDRWVAISASNESYWTGLVRNSVTPVPAGSFTKVVAGSGIELAARSTSNPGVDVTIPAYGLREELVKRAEAAARLSRETAVFDYAGGFTGNTTNGSAAITSVAGITYPCSYIGARISGSGIPANSTIVAVSGTTIYISAPATATATGVSITFLDFALPAGMEARAVLTAGALKQEGATKDFTRLYDGFVESIRFGAAPGVTAWVQVQAQRISQ